MKIELSDLQKQQVKKGGCVEIFDPVSASKFVLIAHEQFEQVRHLLEHRKERQREDVPTEIPPGILRSQQSFWHDLPEMLKNKRNHGKWVCYYGDEQVGIASDDADLIRKCIQRNLADDSYFVSVIEPHDLAPWEVEEIESPRFREDVAELQMNSQSGVSV